MLAWQLYRSPVLANPVWKEQALYGGYEWIEVSEGFWVNRRWEAELSIFQRIRDGKLQCQGMCIKEFLDMLTDAGVFLNRVCMDGNQIVSKAKFDDYLRVRTITQAEKTFGALKHWSTLLIYGVNDEIKEFCDKYGDRFDEVLCSEHISIDDNHERVKESTLRKAHLQQRVLVAKEYTNLKEQIVNWSLVSVM